MHVNRHVPFYLQIHPIKEYDKSFFEQDNLAFPRLYKELRSFDDLLLQICNNRRRMYHQTTYPDVSIADEDLEGLERNIDEEDLLNQAYAF